MVRASRLFAATIILVTLTALALGFNRSGAAAGEERVFSLVASRYSFDPPRLHVNVGDRVTLRVTSADVAHGIYLDGYGINEKIVPGEEKVVTFVADKPGKFRFRCSVICGSMHPFMIGEIVVQPNSPLKVAGIMILALASGYLGYYWWRKEGA